MLWDTATGREVRGLISLSATLCDLRFRPDGKRILCSAHDLHTQIVDVANDKEVFNLPGNLALFTPDGRAIVNADPNDGKARVCLADFEVRNRAERELLGGTGRRGGACPLDARGAHFPATAGAAGGAVRRAT